MREVPYWLKEFHEETEAIRERNAEMRQETENLRQQNTSLRALRELNRSLERVKQIVEASIIKPTPMDDEQLLEQVTYGLDLIKDQMRQNKETLVRSEKYLREIQESNHLVAKEDLFDTQAAASYLGVTHQDTIRNWLEGGSFPGAFQSRGQWFFPAVELNKVKRRLDAVRNSNSRGELPQPVDFGEDCDGCTL